MPSAAEPACLDCLNCRHRTLRVFCDLHAEALAEFNTMGTLRHIESGHELFAESMPVQDIFVLCHGKVKLLSTSRQGKSLVLKIAGPGDVLGLGAAIAGHAHEITALATEPVQVKAIPCSELLAFLDRHAEGGVHAARSVSAEYETAFVGVRRLALSSSSAAKLASLLLEWAHALEASVQLNAPLRFVMPLTHEEIAGMIGSTRETVTRTLNRFKRDKLIEIRGASIILLAPGKLRELIA